MKPKEPTPAQKLHILLMCKMLFPEYKNINFSPLGFVKFATGDETRATDFLLIHWYELCLNHIAHKIFDNLCNQGFPDTNLSCYGTRYQMMIKAVMVDKEDIIDYLFERYLSI